MNSKIGDKEYNVLMAHLEAGCEANGIASVRFNDGEMIMISLKTLNDLVKKIENSDQTRAIIFVNNGPNVDIKEMIV
jgi:hypothetical protein